jgi:hypothetical protein
MPIDFTLNDNQQRLRREARQFATKPESYRRNRLYDSADRGSRNCLSK